MSKPKKPRPSDNEVVCHTAAIVDGQQITQGQRFKRSDSLPQKYPGLFVAASEVGDNPSSTELDLIAGRGEKPRQSQVVPLPGGSFEVEALE